MNSQNSEGATKDAEVPEGDTNNQPEVNQSPPPPEMRCITLLGFGGIKNTKVQKKPELKAGDGEILIRVKACGLNFVDLMIRQGVTEGPPKTPLVMGFECSGDVEALGENVTDFVIGDRVIAFCDYNAWAETVSVPAKHVYKMPTGMSFQDGAALPMNYLTAYIILFELGGLRKGQSLLVHSVGGGVGHAVCQLAKTVEDVQVFGTASYNKHDAIKNNVSYLYDHVVDYVQEVKKVSPEGVDLVLDCLCGDDVNKGITLVKPMGRYILYGTSNIVTGETRSFFSLAKSWWQVDKISPMKLFEENKTITGFHLRTLLFKQDKHEYVRGLMDTLFKLYNTGKIRPQIDSAYAFEDIGEAMQKMHDRKNIGKIILDPGLQSKDAQSASETTASSDSTEKEAEK
ncbi:unnamed protein product [Owenia fusiformis]|uniref:Uncharacterized protein n=1 Tax=Owenia fusiformis TaxID=6347 RepID=A0A8J1UVS1_OWEFU|nr:unnamed protein product [Owenia fusiformis]